MRWGRRRRWSRPWVPRVYSARGDRYETAEMTTYRPVHWTLAISAMAFMLVGCGGAKLLKESHPQQTTQPLATAADSRVTSTLDWVIVRNGPGAWAKNGDWDEYLLRIHNNSTEPVLVTNIMVLDSLQSRVDRRANRRELVKGTKDNVHRYRDSGLTVKAGAGSGELLAAGAAVTAVGVGVAASALTTTTAYGATWIGGVSTGTATAASGLLLLGPALAVGGVLRGINNSRVDDEIQSRRTVLPLTVAPGQQQPIDVFFPIAPAPVQVILFYVDDEGEHQLTFDTRAVLAGLHLESKD